MTIRSGGRPRDRRQPHARRFEADAYATDYVPVDYEPSRRYGNGNGGGGRRRGGRGGGLTGLIKFLLFAVALAALVLLVALTALRPLVNSAILSWASDSPAALNLPFVADIVREDLGDSLTKAVSSDPEQVEFLVEEGDTASTIAERLGSERLVRDPRAFVFIASSRKLTGDLQQGTFVLRRNMTPDQLVSALLVPQQIPYVEIALRTQLRLEQITAKLQTLPLEMDVREFYELADQPPATLIDDYPWLKKILADAPEGASLQGFLWPGTYRVLPDTTPEELIRKMLDAFHTAVGDARLNVPAARGLTFYQVMALASIVEREAVLEPERPLIAGVYQNRIDGIPGIKNRILNADPTIIYAVDTLALADREFETWQEYTFWKVPETAMKDVVLPDDLLGYQTYTQPGLIPGPICTPTLGSIDAALRPDTTDKFIYFLAIPEGDGAHVFARNAKEHDANRRKYGYIG